ncbi:OmpA family protein [Candidatus Symbiobacter mobilis]|uniref:Peptidoglycan-associated protein n=1 Tax=Candidatus Symbiobacter mobilis CR TaxID=946483 RepID=U5N883_9BURK|nr:OmpA family protein [Candidatus Symbiobacter mobilis]AGX87520.1 peptidoglycan-associated protein [Candidatus Symbiobacter mobilis CR]
MTTRTPLCLALLSAALLSACSTVPTPNAQLTQAKSDLIAVQSDPRTNRMAATELQQAIDALNTATAAWVREDPPDQVNHLAYLTRQRVAIARETVALRSAEQAAGATSSTRSNIQLQARTQEADSAERKAELAESDAQAAQQGADIALAAATEAQLHTDLAQAQNRELQERLRELNARPTPQGILLTLGDVLFDTDKAQLKPAGLHLVRQLATVLNDYPTHNVRVEGFTDSTGTEAHNLNLSGQRAEAVRAALLHEGVSPIRVTTQALGESNPVASNDSADGRMLNRRVEIVLFDGRKLNTQR